MLGNVLFVGENLVPDSHTFDVISAIECFSDEVIKLNYVESYKENGKKKFESLILEYIELQYCNSIFFAIGEWLAIDILFIKRINAMEGVKVILIVSDSEHQFEDVDRYYAQSVDLVWSLSPAVLPLYDLYRTKAVFSHPFDVTRYPKKYKEKKYDVSFVGGVGRSNRMEYLEYLISKGVNVYLAGYGTKIGSVSVSKKNDIVYSSKINLNFTGVENKKRGIFSRVTQPKGRVMEVSMLGGFSLSEYSYGLEKIYDIGHDIDVFSSKEELLEKVIFYLSSENLRDKMAVSAHKKSFSLFESCSSFKVVLHALSDNRSALKTYYIDKQFSAIFTSQRMYYMGIFFLKGMFREAVDEFMCAFRYGGFRARNVYYDIPRSFFHFFFR